jgi:arginase
MMRRDCTIALIGAPTDIGAGERGAAMGPEALRVAGLATSLEALGYAIVDRGNLRGPVNPEHPRDGDYRHLPEVTAWCSAVRDETAAVLAAGDLPILMGGDHSLAIGSIAAVARHCEDSGRPLMVFWLDAHSDFNVGESSPTGNIHGMPAAVVMGRGPRSLLDLGHRRPMLEPEQMVQIGTRSIDELERVLLVDMQITVYDMRQIDEQRMRRVMQKAIAAAGTDCHLHVSFDVDFLDPSIAPGVPTRVSGGPTYREAQLCMEMIYDTGLVGSVDVMELNPAHDDGNRTAELAVELMESLFGAQILARPRGATSKYGL